MIKSWPTVRSVSDERKINFSFKSLSHIGNTQRNKVNQIERVKK